MIFPCEKFKSFILFFYKLNKKIFAAFTLITEINFYPNIIFSKRLSMIIHENTQIA